MPAAIKYLQTVRRAFVDCIPKVGFNRATSLNPRVGNSPAHSLASGFGSLIGQAWRPTKGPVLRQFFCHYFLQAPALNPSVGRVLHCAAYIQLSLLLRKKRRYAWQLIPINQGPAMATADIRIIWRYADRDLIAPRGSIPSLCRRPIFEPERPRSAN
jgi:hypothetical protein